MMIFPTSPVWADITRHIMWQEETVFYDSGKFQGSTPWVRPLYKYDIQGTNFTEVKQNSLEAFFNALKGRSTPFLFKDPYAYLANGIVQPSTTSMGNGSGFYAVQANSWRVLPDSSGLRITCGRSGQLTAGSHYVASMDNGWITTKVAPSSIWTSSFEYFRKVVFEENYAPGSDIWNNFHATLSIREILP